MDPNIQHAEIIVYPNSGIPTTVADPSGQRVGRGGDGHLKLCVHRIQAPSTEEPLAGNAGNGMQDILLARMYSYH